jgi:phospholipid/cholesterol/gamma-HCH transport system permease protein
VSAAAMARSFVEDIGELAAMGARTVSIGVRRPRALREVIPQLDALGVRSLLVAVLTAIFSGLVMTVQFSLQLSRFGAKQYVGNIVSLSLVRELGPVLTALLVGGRIGAGIAAQLGSMRVTDQVDAMRSMGADPIEELVVPRVVAGAIALPLLTVFADLLGIAAATTMAALDTGVHARYFYSAITQAVTVSDLVGGLVKTVVFGVIITLIACHRGLATRGGTEGVGRATTETVVFASIAVIVSDFVLTEALLGLGL